MPREETNDNQLPPPTTTTANTSRPTPTPTPPPPPPPPPPAPPIQLQKQCPLPTPASTSPAIRHNPKISWAGDSNDPQSPPLVSWQAPPPLPDVPLLERHDEEETAPKSLRNNNNNNNNNNNDTHNTTTSNYAFLANFPREPSSSLVTSSLLFGGTRSTNSGQSSRRLLPSSMSATSSSSHSSSNSTSTSTRRFNLNHVLGSGPVELEAETHILKACEKLFQNSSNDNKGKDEHDDEALILNTLDPRNGGDSQVIMKSFTKGDEDDEDDDEDSSDDSNDDSDDFYDDHDDDDDDCGDEAVDQAGELPQITSSMNSSSRAIPLAMPPPATTITDNRSNNNNNNNNNNGTSKSQHALVAKTKFKTLVRKQIVKKNVEQTLFGLTSTLHQMQEDNDKQEEMRRVQQQHHHRMASQINGQESELLAATVQSLSGLVHGGGGRRMDTTTTTSTSSRNSGILGISTPALFATSNPLEEEAENSSSDNNGRANHSSTTTKKKKKKGKWRLKRKGAASGLREDFELFRAFLSPRKARIKQYLRRTLLFVVLPSMAIAILLFYFAQNPTTCKRVIRDESAADQYEDNGTDAQNEEVAESDLDLQVIKIVCGASVSWWLLFIGVRQVITLTMALATQAFIIDFLALGTRVCLRFLGPLITLFIVKSKGWPFIAIFWAAYDLILLTGDREYAHHWGYWQNWIGLFNDDNPSGTVVYDPLTYLILRLMIIVGVSVSVKRLAMGLFLGRQTFANFGEELASVMQKMILIGQVATLAKDIEYTAACSSITQTLASSSKSMADDVSRQWSRTDIQELVSREADAESAAVAEAVRDSQLKSNAAMAARTYMASRRGHPPVIDSSGIITSLPTSFPESDRNVEQDFTASEQRELSELLDAWEEPQTAEQRENRKITIGAVLQFKNALTFMEKKQPFLPAFGPADTREKCIQSAQKIFDRLMLRTPNQHELPFETLALLAKDSKGGINQEKAKELIKVFRPERDGKLSKLEFVKSIDTLYKSIRLLSANVRNSSQISKAVNGLVNILFYIILGGIVLAQLGIDPMQLFFSFSSFFLAFVFMFGKSSSNYFEGILFILVQQPYGVGDRIHLSNPQLETNVDGSSGWFVEKVTLYSTTLKWGATNESCSISNGAIANLRVINANRSPHAQIYVHIKFAVDTPYDKIMIFKAAVEEYLKDRPREWLTFVGFRPTEVAVERRFINYVIIAQHRNSWQGIGAILESKGYLVTYCLEVAKQLEMRYVSPNLPVSLNLNQSNELTPTDLNAAGW